MRRMLTLLPAALVLALGTQAWAFEVSSPEIANGATIKEQQVFKGFGCTGDNISPSLEWKDPPAGTKSFAVTAYDPDAPTGSGWWHWVIFNIPATATKLPLNAGNRKAHLAPKGAIQSTTDFGSIGYGGPCPPKGDKPHHYIFTVFALKIDKLPLKSKSSGALVGFYLNANVLGKATLTGLYGR